MKTQIKFVVDQRLAERFKEEVLRRRGKMELSREAEEALRLYIRKRETSRQGGPPAKDSILEVIGIAKSTGGRVNALEDERRLYERS